MIKNKALVKKYAAALYEVSAKADVVSVIFDDLANISKIFLGHKDEANIMCSSKSPRKMKRMFLNTALMSVTIHDITKSFLSVLIKNNRMHLIGDIVQQLDKIMLAKNGIVEASLVLYNDSEEMEKLIVNNLEAILEKKLKINVSNDSSLLGGFVLTVENKILDCSWRNRLNQLKRVLELK